MANDATKVVVGSPLVGGYAFSAVLGTAVPDDATTPLVTPLSIGGLGYISEDGVTRAVDVTTEEVRDWNGDVIRVLQTEISVEFTFTLQELNANSLKAIYGADAVTVTATSIDIAFDGDALPHAVWDFELKDGDNTGRIVIGDGQVTNPGGGEITFARNAAITHELTVRCYRDEDGVFYHHYNETPVETP